MIDERIRRLVAIEVMKALEAEISSKRADIVFSEGFEKMRGVYDRTKRLSRGETASIKVAQMINLLAPLKNETRKNLAISNIRRIEIGLSIGDGQIDLRMSAQFPNTARFMQCRDAEANAAFGPLIIAWSGINAEFSELSLGVPSRNVLVIDRKRNFPLPEEAVSLLKPKSGRDLLKFCLTDVSPADYRDSLEGQVRLEVEHTRYSQIFMCEPYFHRENVRAAFTPTFSDEELFENRAKYGSLVPGENKIPHSLTMLYTLVTTDGYVMLMRRSSTVDYYPGTIDLSGGEQLDEKDFFDQHDSVFEAWAKRAVIEEWFPSMNLDKKSFINLKEKIPVTVHLQAIAYNELDGNYPVLALIRMGLTLSEFKSMSDEIMKQSNYTVRYEGEGVRCFALIESMRNQIKAGLPIRYTKISTDGGMNTDKDCFSIERQQLHPATPLRLHLLMALQDIGMPVAE